MHDAEPADGLDAEPIVGLDTLAPDAARSILELLDARTLARARGCSRALLQLVDGIAADLLVVHMRECRRRAAQRRTFLPRGSEAVAFVGTVTSTGAIHLLGGMLCGGHCHKRSLHSHTVASASFAFKAASYCGQQALLLLLLTCRPGPRERQGSCATS